jgi:FAD synthetase
MKRVVVVGTFDILHLGHVWLLKKAKEYGDWLIVVVARDIKSEQVKGRKPIFPEEERVELLQNLKIVDEVMLGYPKDRLKIIEELNPDVLVLGPDPWKKEVIEQELKKKGLNVKIVQITQVYSKGKFHRTSQIIDFIVKEFKLE